jgi:hypothetical protein
MNFKVGVSLLLVLLVFPIVLGEVTVERSEPSVLEQGKTTNITIQIVASEPVTVFDLVEFTPQGWVVTTWDVQGIQKSDVKYDSRDQYYQGLVRTGNHWQFKGPVQGTMILTYDLIPVSAGSQEFITVWTYPAGFDSQKIIRSVIPPSGTAYCGNKVCDMGENADNCPLDCKIPVIVYDITIIITIGVIIAAVILTILAKKGIDVWEALRIVKERILAEERHGKKAPLEDLRAYMKLGLQRGYTLRQMAEALRGAGVDDSDFRRIASETEFKRREYELNKRLNGDIKEIDGNDAVIRRLKQIIIKLKK